jgi:uncharacterized protein (DUF849 family)
LPITPDEIVAESVAAAEAGASIIHLHARDPNDGRPSADLDLFMQFLPRIKQQTGAVLNITTGGAPGMSLAQRIAAAERASPEMTSLNMGSINNGLFAGARRIKDYKFDWERPFLEGGRSSYFENSFFNIETIMKRLGQEHGVRFEFECYDLGHIYNLAHMIEQKLYDGPLFLQFILGILGGVGAEVDNLLLMIRTAQRLFGNDVEWSVLAAGRHQMPICVHNALIGGNGGQPQSRAGRNGEIQRRSGGQDPSDPDRTRLRHRHPRRSARAAGTRGQRQRHVLNGAFWSSEI